MQGTPTDEAVAAMAAGGIVIRGRTTRPCAVRRLQQDEAQRAVPPPPPPLGGTRAPKGETSWLEVRRRALFRRDSARFGEI